MSILLPFLVLGFTRGDVDQSGAFSRDADLRALLVHLRDGTELVCADAADVNDDGLVDLSDAIAIVDGSGGGPDMEDLTEDELSCAGPPSLRYSVVPRSVTPLGLDSSTLDSGVAIYITLEPQAEVAGPVDFRLDGGAPRREGNVPWDFAGGSVETPRSWTPTSTTHTISATWPGGSATATFSVGAAPPPPDPPPTEPPPTGLVSEITRHGIAWRFDREVTAGTFANGDPWVVGPVTVVSTDPSWNGRLNGTMQDPVWSPDHGWEARFSSGYKDALRFKFPGTVEPGHSLVTVRSRPESENSNTWPGSDGALIPRPCFEVAACLTVLAQAPPANSMRPAYAGLEKRIYAAPGTAPEPLIDCPAGWVAADVVRNARVTCEGFWLDTGWKWKASAIAAKKPWGDEYGREIAARHAECSLALLMRGAEESDRVALAVGLAQQGIDQFWLQVHGAKRGAHGGGLGVGRKWPVLLAGQLLEDADMLEGWQSGRWDLDVTAEDCQILDNGTFHSWGCLDNSLPDPGAGYRTCCTANGWIGQALAAELMGLDDEWARPIFFTYTHAYAASRPVGDWQRSWSKLVEAVWDQEQSR